MALIQLYLIWNLNDKDMKTWLYLISAALFTVLLLSVFLIEVPTSEVSDSQEEPKKLYLFAERKNGPISMEEFVYDTDEVFYFTDSKWGHSEGEIVGTYNQTLGMEVPKVLMPWHGATLNLLWEVPGFGRTVLRLDLTDYKDGKILSLNRELAKQKRSSLLEEKEEYNFDDLGKYLKLSESKMDDGLYLEALNHSLHGLEASAIKRAKQETQMNRKKDYEIKITNEKGEPVPNITVKYELEDLDFDLGWSSPKPTPDISKKAENLGLNTYQQFSFWYETQPEGGIWDFEMQISRIEATENFNQKVSGLISEPPTYLSDIEEGKLHRGVEKHVNKTVRTLEKETDVSAWECYGYGMHYGADQTLHITLGRSKKTNMNTTVTCIETVTKESDSEVIVTGWNIDGSDVGNTSYSDVPYEYYKKIADKTTQNFSVGFDFMYFGGAHELYPKFLEEDIYRKEAFGEDDKNWIPARSLYSVSEMLDWYSDLDKDVHIQYFNAPSNHLENHRGYWKEPWDEEIQAEWIKNYYKVVYGKPHVKGITYLELKDAEWKDLKTGLLEKDGTPKRSYHKLKGLIDNWKTTGSQLTDADGKIEFQGHGGEYMIEVIDENRTEKKTAIDSNTTLVI